MRTKLTRLELIDHIDHAKPGTRIIYHVGSLIKDRQKGLDFMQVHAVALTAWAAMEAGHVELKQRMVLPGICEYVAQKRPGPHKPVQWEGCYHPEWRGP